MVDLGKLEHLEILKNGLPCKAIIKLEKNVT